jgi:hypothetical protein
VRRGNAVSLETLIISGRHQGNGGKLSEVYHEYVGMSTVIFTERKTARKRVSEGCQYEK